MAIEENQRSASLQKGQQAGPADPLELDGPLELGYQAMGCCMVEKAHPPLQQKGQQTGPAGPLEERGYQPKPGQGGPDATGGAAPGNIPANLKTPQPPTGGSGIQPPQSNTPKT